jgi:hypothetical protein
MMQVPESWVDIVIVSEQILRNVPAPGGLKRKTKVYDVPAENLSAAYVTYALVLPVLIMPGSGFFESPIRTPQGLGLSKSEGFAYVKSYVTVSGAPYGILDGSKISLVLVFLIVKGAVLQANIVLREANAKSPKRAKKSIPKTRFMCISVSKRLRNWKCYNKYYVSQDIHYCAS